MGHYTSFHKKVALTAVRLLLFEFGRPSSRGQEALREELELLSQVLRLAGDPTWVRYGEEIASTENNQLLRYLLEEIEFDLRN